MAFDLSYLDLDKILFVYFFQRDFSRFLLAELVFPRRSSLEVTGRPRSCSKRWLDLPAAIRKKRKYDLGRPAANTKVREQLLCFDVGFVG